jgi:hypothetical protein
VSGRERRLLPVVCIVSAHTAALIISTVTVHAAGQPAAVALAVVSDALNVRSYRPADERIVVADLG